MHPMYAFLAKIEASAQHFSKSPIALDGKVMAGEYMRSARDGYSYTDQIIGKFRGKK